MCRSHVFVYRCQGSCHNSVLPTASISRSARRPPSLPATVQLAAIDPVPVAPLVNRRRSPSVGVSRRQVLSARRLNRGPGSRGLTRRRSVSAAGQAGSPTSPRDPCKSTVFNLSLMCRRTVVAIGQVGHAPWPRAQRNLSKNILLLSLQVNRCASIL